MTNKQEFWYMMLTAGILGVLSGVIGLPWWSGAIIGFAVSWMRWHPRKPDFLIGGSTNPYMRRWWVIPRNKYFNIYLHHFLRSDDDRALHDHPWWNMSILLWGKYIEHMPRDPVAYKAGRNRAHIQKLRSAPFIYMRGAEAIHRVELLKRDCGCHEGQHCPEQKEKPVWTLFITGPKWREWGFWCPKGFKHYQDYTKTTKGVGEVGEGCGD